MTTATAANPGVLHRGRVLDAGDQSGTYTVALASLAPGNAWGPIPSLAPGLQPGDRVLLAQVGTTQSDLVIVGKIPGTEPGIGDIPGLIAALAAKANVTDLTALANRVTTDEANIATNTTNIATNTSNIAANSAAITALQGRATSDEANIAANAAAITALQGRMTTAEANISANSALIANLAADRRASYGVDYDLMADYADTLPRLLASGSLSLTNGSAFAVRMRVREKYTLASVKFCFSAAGTLGSSGKLYLGVWAGHPQTALPFIQIFPITNVAVGRQDYAITTPPTLAAADDIVLAWLAVGMTTPPTLSASPSVSPGLVNQTTTTQRSVRTTSTSLTALTAAPLDFTNTSSAYTTLSQAPWAAMSGSYVP